MTDLGNRQGYISNSPVFWIGQVPPYQEINKRDKNRWGSRVKVRIMGIHSPNGTSTPDSGLTSAQVLLPTSHGTLNMTSTGIVGGEIVFGMYLHTDGTTLKNPFILGVLARTKDEYDITADTVLKQKSTEFKRILPFWSLIQPQSYQTQGGDEPDSQQPVQLPTQDFFKKNPLL